MNAIAHRLRVDREMLVAAGLIRPEQAEAAKTIPARAPAATGIVASPDNSFAQAARDIGLPEAMVSRVPRDVPLVASVEKILLAAGLFDAVWYRGRHQDVDLGDLDPCVHFLTIGWKRGLTPNFYFDTPFYEMQMPADLVHKVNPLLHYIYVGEAEGLKPMPHFDPVWYRERYGIGAQSPLCHYIRNLDSRRFSPNPDFDVGFYLLTYPDVRQTGYDPVQHYIAFGRDEGRSARPSRQPESRRTPHEEVTAPLEAAPAPDDSLPVAERPVATSDIDASRLILASGLFDARVYRRASGQSSEDGDALVRHYLSEGAVAGFDPHPLFATRWYRTRYADALGDGNPLVHYLTEGWRRHFDPHPLFSVGFYLEHNADVREAGREPLRHYLESGGLEGRAPCEDFDGVYYLAQYADVAQSGQNPLVHYLEFGTREARNPSATFDTDWYARHVALPTDCNPLVHFRALDPASKAIATPPKIRLAADRTISDAELSAWTDHLAAVAGRSHRRADGAPLVVARAIARGASSPRMDGDVALREIAWEQALAEASSAFDDEAFYLVVGPTDEVDTRFSSVISDAVAHGGLLGVFDYAYRRADRWALNLLPGANVVLLESVDATFSRYLISKRLLRLLAPVRSSTPAEVLTLALAHLRAEAHLGAVRHVPWPILRAPDMSNEIAAARSVLAERREMDVGRRTARPRSVSVVICTKDRGHLLSQLIDGLLRHPPMAIEDIVVVANTPARPHVQRIHARYAAHDRITFLREEGVYNFSAQSNRGAELCRGELLLFLNDDIVPIAPDWLEQLCTPFERPEVGVTGPLLLYPDESVQHAGMYLGFNGCAGHTLRGSHVSDESCSLGIVAPRNVTAVTGAALLTPRALFEDLNGFDRQLATYLQDVDYCLRVRNIDRDIVYEPASLLFHMESVSMRDVLGEPAFQARRALEHRHFHRKWPGVMATDEFHNPNLDIGDQSLGTLRRRLR